MRILVIVLSVLVPLLSSPVMADGGGSGGGGNSWNNRPKNADFTAAKDLLKQQRYADAIPLLLKAVGAEPKNPDFLTDLAFAYRKTNQFDPAYKYYDMALSIDPDHTGALNYLGILYVQTGQLAKANELLQRIDDACWFSCTAYDTLKQAIEDGGEYSRY